MKASIHQNNSCELIKAKEVNRESERPQSKIKFICFNIMLN